MLTRVLDPRENNGIKDVSARVKKQQQGAETISRSMKTHLSLNIFKVLCVKSN